MGRFIGGRFGSIVPIASGTVAPSGVYTASDQYYAKQDGGWVNPTGMSASGGVVSDYVVSSDIYRAHIFTSTGEFAVTELSTSLSNDIEYLVVAGGGGGGGDAQSGGGGAGGFRTNLTGHPVKAADYTAEVGTYTVTVGGGGAGGNNTSTHLAFDGGNSEFYLNGTSYPAVKRVRSVGGGGSRGYGGSPVDGNPGGSGGGTFNRSGSSSGGAGNTPTDPNHPQVQGYKGGDSPTYVSPHQGGGGGGAGGEGAPDNPAGPFPGAGGRSQGGYGLQALIAGPPAQPQPMGTPGPGSGAAGTGYFAGGGGGGGYDGHPPGAAGGYGGGGPGGVNPGGRGVSGTTSTGGGGGGSRGPAGGSGGNGASGIVIVRYKIGSVQSSGTSPKGATGGNISSYGSKTIHTFTSSGTFTNPASIDNVEVVMIAGGGAGGNNIGSGGGAGAVLESPGSGFTFPNNTYTITVGSGGAGATFQGPTTPGTATDTTITYPGPYTWTAQRGGYGSSYTSPVAQSGGSGGGGGNSNPAGGAKTAANSPTPIGTLIAYGNVGGTSSGSYQGGGGGGAGAAGTGGNSGVGGAGGLGRQLPSTFQNPVSAPSDTSNPQPYQRGGGLGTPGPAGGYYVAAGGGGAAYNTDTPGNRGLGGAGGGGDGGYHTQAPPATDAQSALENTGSGGGGSGYSPSAKSSSGSGGSGIVLIAYPS